MVYYQISIFILQILNYQDTECTVDPFFFDLYKNIRSVT